MRLAAPAASNQGGLGELTAPVIKVGRAVLQTMQSFRIRI